MAAVNPPIGTISAYAGPRNTLNEGRDGWLVCDGRRLNKTDFPKLFDAIGTTWGGDGAPSFHLPDLGGRFLRGVDRGAADAPSNPARDADRDQRVSPLEPGTPNPGNQGNRVGSMQADAFQSHVHVDRGHAHSFPEAMWSQPRNENGGDHYANYPGEANWPNHRRHEATNASVAQLTPPVDDGHGVPRLSTETRPVNSYVYWIIRAN